MYFQSSREKICVTRHQSAFNGTSTRSLPFLKTFLYGILQQWWWITTIIQSPGKPRVIDGGCLEERNKAQGKKKKKKKLPSCIHECCFIWKKDTDKGPTLKKCFYIYAHPHKRAKWLNKQKTPSEETLREDLVCCSFRGEWEATRLLVSNQKVTRSMASSVFSAAFQFDSFFFFFQFLDGIWLAKLSVKCRHFWNFPWAIKLVMCRLHLSINFPMLGEKCSGGWTEITFILTHPFLKS